MSKRIFLLICTIQAAIIAAVSYICFVYLDYFTASIITFAAGVIIIFGICMIIYHKNAYNINENDQKKVNNSPDELSIIAHELRSPVTAIKGYLCAMKDGVIPNEQQAQYLDIAINESDRSIKMLEDFMSLMRFDSKSIILTEKNFDINELIRLIIIEKTDSIDKKQITVETAFSNEQEYVFADKNLIKQVLINLIDNAVKYNKTGGTVKISTSALNDNIHITVADTGIGISAEMLPFIWQRYYQADRSNSSTYKGHGLGLCIVKEIISAHKQTIEVSSTPECGTEFTFTLQRKKDTDI